MTTSWVEVSDESDFSLDNLPFGVFIAADTSGVGVAIGDQILDLRAATVARLLPDECYDATTADDLTELLGGSPTTWRVLRDALTTLLADGDARRDRTRACLVPQAHASMRLPFRVGDYVDFYSSLEHATNLGRLMRPGQEPLLPNWRHLPVGYHGRASTVVVSGTAVRRPLGQTKPPDADAPTFGPTKMLDFELEVGFVTGGAPNAHGAAIDIDDAERHIFGMVLVNDWSARDIQAWEYQPLGPFLAKSFATSVSPWVVPLAALEPFRLPAPPQDPAPLDYLKERDRRGVGVQLTVEINGTLVTKTGFGDMYWTMAQQLAHMTVNGTVVRPGDLYASGTVSGTAGGTQGSLIELTQRGAAPITLDDGSTRAFLEDGDRVVMRGLCRRDGCTVGFGSVEGTVLPAVASRS